MLTFHEVVNHMQEDEEEVINDHSVMVDVRFLFYIYEKNCKKLHPCVIKMYMY